MTSEEKTNRMNAEATIVASLAVPATAEAALATVRRFSLQPWMFVTPALREDFSRVMAYGPDSIGGRLMGHEECEVWASEDVTPYARAISTPPVDDVRGDMATRCFAAGAGRLMRSFADIPPPPSEAENPDALFRNGWARRGHFGLLVATSGVGKSVISTQDAIMWAMGRPGLVGSPPIRPLRVGMIQAEDDDTEMGWFRENHRMGFAAEGYSPDELDAAERAVTDFSRVFAGVPRGEFCATLDNALYARPQDVVILNPLQSYVDADISKNVELSDFLRTRLDPILKRHKVFMLCIHHTNKPPSAADRKGWGADAMAAYLGAGGAELVNYARSVTVVSPIEKPGADGFFWLYAAKRGRQCGWKTAAGAATVKRIIAHSAECVHWRVPDAEEVARVIGGSAPSAAAAGNGVENARALAEEVRRRGRVSLTELRSVARERYERKWAEDAVARLRATPAAYGLREMECASEGCGRPVTTLAAADFGVEDHVEELMP